MSIHGLALVDSSAQIDEDVHIGPWTMIGSNVKIGKGCRIANSVTIKGYTELGQDNHVAPGSVLGGPPQDKKYKGGETKLVIGDRNDIRECVTINVGTEKGGGVTTIGDDNFLMACCHVAHDCHVHNKTIIPNGVLLAGHVTVEDCVVFGGLVGIQHFTTIGKFAFIGGLTRVIHDVPPFMLLEGHPSRVRTINRVGLERGGFSEESIEALKYAHRILFRKSITRKKAFEKIKSSDHFNEDVAYLLDFLDRADKGVQGRANQPAKH